MLTLGQAAKIAGCGKTTLTRAIKAGRLSATRNDDGSYAIDASEFARVFSVTLDGVPATGASVHRATRGDSEIETRLALAEAKARALEDMLAEVRQSRDDWKAQAERLALTSPAPPPTPAAAPPLPAPEPRRPWWRRLAG